LLKQCFSNAQVSSEIVETEMSFSMQPETKDSFKSLSFRGVFEEILLHSTDVFILPIPSTHGCFVCFSFVSIPWIFADVLLAEVLFKLYFLSN
jgi:hypothetical protein